MYKEWKAGKATSPTCPSKHKASVSWDNNSRIYENTQKKGQKKKRRYSEGHQAITWIVSLLIETWHLLTLYSLVSNPDISAATLVFLLQAWILHMAPLQALSLTKVRRMDYYWLQVFHNYLPSMAHQSSLWFLVHDEQQGWEREVSEIDSNKRAKIDSLINAIIIVEPGVSFPSV